MNYIDTHTHINLQAFDSDAEAVIQRAHSAGVAIVNIGTQFDTSQKAVDLLAQFPTDVYATVGLHPSNTYDAGFHDSQELKEKTIEQDFNYKNYKQLALNDRVVGIGECGLDYYRLPQNVDIQEIKKHQLNIFLSQVDLALELGRALSIHCRPSQNSQDAYEDMYQIIKEKLAVNSSLRFVIHSYTGSPDMATKFCGLGGFIGLNGIITFDNTSRSRDVVTTLPLSAVVLETDAPYLAPVPYRGKRNEPGYLLQIASQIASWKNLTIDEVAVATTKNAQKLFNIIV